MTCYAIRRDTMLYPLKFKPLYKDYVWGGRNLEKLGKTLPEGIVAESWEVSCHKNGPSIVANGEYEGVDLPSLVARFGRTLLGNSLSEKDIMKFPLLLKLIDADKNLSVQVHPDDAYANLNENGEYGKNEMWYIIDAKPGASIVYDVMPGTTRESFAKAVNENIIETCLKTFEVFPGDAINIPSGLVHAIGQGIMLAEVQQNSDITYRVYDYGRIGRELHIKKALDVIDFNSNGRKEKYRGLKLDLRGGSSKTYLIANKYFCAELYRINNAVDSKVFEDADGSKFCIYTFLKGSGSLEWEGGLLDVQKGESVLIPACLGKYALSGAIEVLKSYVPEIEVDILRFLGNAGFSREQISSNIGGFCK
jgi:mannose-6-phosphate isomerase